MNCHEAIDVMGDAVERRLQAALRPGFEEHMAECRACRTYYEHLRITRAALQHLPCSDATSPRRDELLDSFRREFDREH